MKPRNWKQLRQAEESKRRINLKTTDADLVRMMDTVSAVVMEYGQSSRYVNEVNGFIVIEDYQIHPAHEIWLSQSSIFGGAGGLR